MTKAQQLGIRSKNESSKGSITEFPYYEYNSNGYEIYYEDSTGFWIKNDYDSNGNKIYYENSSGYSEKNEYDSNGSLIYCKCSNGDWQKYDYDSKGNKIFLETPNGYGYFRYYEGNKFIKEIEEGDYKEHYLTYKRNLKLNTLLNDKS